MNPATARRQSRGFTIVELVTTIVILGIVAAIASPRFFNTSSFETAGFAAEVRSGLRHAQTTAMTSGCDIRAQLSSSGFVLQRWSGGAGCNDHTGTLQTLQRAGGGDYLSQPPSGITVGAAALYFDNMGRPRDANSGALLGSALSITVGTDTVVVYPDTGLVR